MEQWRDFFVPEAGDAAADSGDQKFQSRIFLCEPDEFIDIRLDGFNSSLHSWNGIGSTCQSDTDTPFRAEFYVCCPCRTATMMACEIASLCKRLHKEAYVKPEVM